MGRGVDGVRGLMGGGGGGISTASSVRPGVMGGGGGGVDSLSVCVCVGLIGLLIGWLVGVLVGRCVGQLRLSIGCDGIRWFWWWCTIIR